MSIPEQEELQDIVSYVLAGAGLLEPLLARDEIADIMVNGCEMTYIEVKESSTNVRFVDNGQLMNVCQRDSQPGRCRVDESKFLIRDARLPDGSRVNVIVPPLAIDGPYVFTIRKFKRDRLTLDRQRGTSDRSRPRAVPCSLSSVMRALQRHFRRHCVGQDDPAELHDRSYQATMNASSPVRTLPSCNYNNRMLVRLELQPEP